MHVTMIRRDAHGGQFCRADDVPRLGRLPVNEFGPRLNGDRPIRKVQRVNPSARPIARLENHNISAGGNQPLGGRQPGSPCSDNNGVAGFDGHVDPLRRVLGSQICAGNGQFGTTGRE